MKQTRYGALLEASLRKEQRPTTVEKPKRPNTARLAGRSLSTPQKNITWLRNRNLNNIR